VVYEIGRGLWKTDGTEAGTVLLKDSGYGADFFPQYMTNLNGTLYFSSGSDLWKSDGTVAGTVPVFEASNHLNPRYLTNVGGMLYFRGFDEAHGNELWKSDGTAAGTTLVRDIVSGPYDSLQLYDYPQFLRRRRLSLFLHQR
jgi:ELWxxDGT repeat protein